MKLRDIHIPRKAVELSSGHTVEVRGINASDMLLLTTKFGPQIAVAYALFKERVGTGEDATDADILGLIQAVAADAPMLLGWIMAVANDDPTEETAVNVNALPFVDQATLLNEITTLTFSSEATVKKLTESLGGAFLTVFGAMTQDKAPNRKQRRKSARSGTGQSDGK